MSTGAAAIPPSGAKWFDALPKPRSSPRSISVDELHSLLHDSDKRSGVMIVDEPMAFMIPSAINLPAQSFYQTLPALLPLLSRYDHVVFHCSTSAGRGPRCAAWYQDACEDSGQSGNALILQGGIKAWAARYGEEVVAVTTAA